MKVLSRSFLPLLVLSVVGASSEVPAAAPSDASSLYPDRNSHAASVDRGHIAFQHYCALCHGKLGDGNGRAAKLHNPRPANLTTSEKNTEYKELILRRGGAALGRSAAMPPWNEELTEEQIADLVNFLQSLVVNMITKDNAIQAKPATK